MKPIKDWVTITSLFTSSSTLFCCALPSLLVAIGLGTVVAGIFSGNPWLEAVVEHHDQIFLTAGALLVLNGWLLFRKRPEICPAPGTSGRETACETAHRWNFWIFWVVRGFRHFQDCHCYSCSPPYLRMYSWLGLWTYIGEGLS